MKLVVNLQRHGNESYPRLGTMATDCFPVNLGLSYNHSEHKYTWRFMARMSHGEG